MPPNLCPTIDKGRAFLKKKMDLFNASTAYAQTKRYSLSEKSKESEIQDPN